MAGVPTSQRALLMVEALVAAQRPMRVAELGQALALPKQTAHRLAQALLDAGFAERDATRRLIPGPRLRQLAAPVLLPDHRRIARHQVLERVSAAVGETCNLVVPEQDGMRYLDRVETSWPLRILLPIGSHVPFHCTASGKLYLSSLSRKARARMLAGLRLDACARNTRTTPEELSAELDAIQARGYSIDDGEMIDGMGAVAVPVRDEQGHFLAALAVHGPLQRFSIEQAEGHVPLLQEAAGKLSQIIAEA